jgi:hypothetical protein
MNFHSTIFSKRIGGESIHISPPKVMTESQVQTKETMN